MFCADCDSIWLCLCTSVLLRSSLKLFLMVLKLPFLEVSKEGNKRLFGIMFNVSDFLLEVSIRHNVGPGRVLK